MRKLLFVLTLVLCVFKGFAQEYKYSLAIRSGLSLPTAAFASKNIYIGSFALPGYSSGIELSGRIYKNWNISIQGALQLYPIDVENLAKEKVEHDPFISQLQIRAEAFRVINYSAGLSYLWYMNDKFILEPKLLAGIVYAKTAYQLNKPEYFVVGPEYFEITSSYDHKMILEPGLGIHYKLRPYFSVKLDFEYISREMAYGFYTWEGLNYDYKQLSFLNSVIALVVWF